jgi:O-antigen ligase/polysaccharide polymerase Wzy-like membrane protein
MPSEATKLSAGPSLPQKEILAGAFFWLSAFYFVYCARPGDWIPGLKLIPLAKITGICAFLGLLMSLGKTRRGFKDLPREAVYLVFMIMLLFAGAFLSPVWRGGAFFRTLDFSKVAVAWVLTFLLVTNFERLRRIIFIQAGSVAIIGVVSILKGRGSARLEGVLGGIYSNPNDLAFAMVLSLPFCLAFMLQTKKGLSKIFWLTSMLAMCGALFMTASRGGFITFAVSGTVCLWHFGVKGKRFYLIVGTGFVGLILALIAGGRLKDRFFAISGEDIGSRTEQRAYGSFEERRELMVIAVHGIAHYPILGIGAHNFPNYSGKWRDVHMTYLQMGVEGGIPALIFYLLFFRRGFTNLRRIRKSKDLSPEVILFTGALHSSLVGFVVGALFAPEAYQYFPYFSVVYTSVLFALTEAKQQPASTPSQPSNPPKRQVEAYARNGRTSPVLVP